MSEEREMKLWLCGLTENCHEQMKDMTEGILKYFDGLIFVDNHSTDGTFEFLDEIKGEGKIIKRHLKNDIDYQLSEILKSGCMENGDWFMLVDPEHRPKEFWLKRIKSQIKGFSDEKIGALSFSGRVYLAQYFDHMDFSETPHWNLDGVVNNIKNCTKEELINYIGYVTPEGIEEKILLNGAKYFYTYGRSNQMNVVYRNYSDELIEHHESHRLQFRLFCEKVLKLDFDLDSLVEQMKKDEWPVFFLESVELETNLKDLYRHKVLGQSFDEIARNRIDWSIEIYLETGDAEQVDTNYKGPLSEYRRKQKEEEEELHDKERA